VGAHYLWFGRPLEAIAPSPLIEGCMAATRKSAKRGTGKKKSTAAKRRSPARASTRKQSSGKAARRRAGSVQRASPKLKRRGQRGLQIAKEGLDTVREAGGRAWQALRATTTRIVDDVKEK
jgi:hypothetical protein